MKKNVSNSRSKNPPKINPAKGKLWSFLPITKSGDAVLIFHRERCCHAKGERVFGMFDKDYVRAECNVPFSTGGAAM